MTWNILKTLPVLCHSQASSKQTLLLMFSLAVFQSVQAGVPTSRDPSLALTKKESSVSRYSGRPMHSSQYIFAAARKALASYRNGSWERNQNWQFTQDPGFCQSYHAHSTQEQTKKSTILCLLYNSQETRHWFNPTRYFVIQDKIVFLTFCCNFLLFMSCPRSPTSAWTQTDRLGNQ